MEGIEHPKPWLFAVYRAMIIPSYIGIMINHHKDPYEPTSIIVVVRVLNVAQLASHPDCCKHCCKTLLDVVGCFEKIGGLHQLRISTILNDRCYTSQVQDFWNSMSPMKLLHNGDAPAGATKGTRTGRIWCRDMGGFLHWVIRHPWCQFFFLTKQHFKTYNHPTCKCDFFVFFLGCFWSFLGMILVFWSGNFMEFQVKNESLGCWIV